jgi:hypothetical protein
MRRLRKFSLQVRCNKEAAVNYLTKMKNVGNNNGVAIVILAIAIFVIAGMVGMAIDVGYAYVVKRQLQSAADAGALAGAALLYPTASTLPLSQLTPDWGAAQAEAPTWVKKNSAAGSGLTDPDIASIEVGYWNLEQVPPGIQPQTTEPKYNCSVSKNSCTPSAASCPPGEICLQQDVPAVQVKLRKSSVETFFARILGWSEYSPGATSVAARGNPASAMAGFPFAVTKCMTDYYLTQVTADPIIQIPAPYAPVPNCNTGNWTSLTLGGNGDSVIKGLMGVSKGIDPIPPVNIRIGDSVQIQPGTEASSYQDAASYIGKTVLVPVVADTLVATNVWSPVMGFIEFTVTGVQATGPDKYITGQFKNYTPGPTVSTLGGPLGNTVTPPVLIR